VIVLSVAEARGLCESGRRRQIGKNAGKYGVVLVPALHALALDA